MVRISRLRRLDRWWLWLSTLMLLSAAWLVQASGIVVLAPRIEADGEEYRLSADFDIDLAPRIEDIINRGIELHFVVDFELVRNRWYWFDMRIAQHSRIYQLSYHALTRRYRLSTGGLHQSFVTLGEALRVLARLRNWPIVGKDALSAGTVYQAAVRMRLDLSQMPRTFQVSAFSSAEWALDSDWLRWRFQPTMEGAASASPTDTAPDYGKTLSNVDHAAGAGIDTGSTEHDLAPQEEGP